MKILICPDSFKGSLTSKQVCSSIKNGIEKYNNNTQIITMPMADGGEGFADCMLNNCNGKTLYTKCHNIYNQEIEGSIVVFDGTAVIETATASGLLTKKRVMQASSYGTGELIKYATEQGYSNIILGLGGSGFCDGGVGALAALGAKFYDENQNIIARPKSNDLNYIFGVSFKDVVKPINFTFACDVDSEYFGKNGAAYVFAPQKGANKTEVEELDFGLRRLNAFFKNDISKIKGTGAAGGLCGGLYAVYGGTIASGFDVIDKFAHIEQNIQNCDIVITGEGKTDSQTLLGKLPYRIASLAKKHNKKCIVISGDIDGVKLGDKMISLVDEHTAPQQAIDNAAQLLEEKCKYILQ